MGDCHYSSKKDPQNFGFFRPNLDYPPSIISLNIRPHTYGGFSISMEAKIWFEELESILLPPWYSSMMMIIGCWSSYYYCFTIIVYAIATTYIGRQSLSRSVYLGRSCTRMETRNHFFTWRVWPIVLLGRFLITFLTLKKLLLATDMDGLVYWTRMDISGSFYFILVARCSTDIFALFLASPRPFAVVW